MDVRFKLPDGSEKTISAESGWTVGQLKEALAKATGHPAAAQRLTVGGKIMKDAKGLSDYPAAAKQACSLVIAEGAAPAAAGAGGGKSGERQAVEGLLNELLKVVRENKEAAAYAEKFQDSLPDTAELREKLGIKDLEDAKQRALDELTKVLEGDWTPFDRYYGPLREYGGKILDGDPTDEKRTQWMEKAATFAMDKLNDFPDIRRQMNEECKPGIDLVETCLPFAKRVFRRGMDLLLDGPSPELIKIDAQYTLFSQQLRLLVVTAVGGLIDVICDCLKDGEPQCRLLMAKLTGKAVELFAEKFPDYEKLAAFVGPMAMNQVMDWFDEYKKTIKGKPGLDLK